MLGLDGYAFSKDYAALFRLMKEQTVICVCRHPIRSGAALTLYSVDYWGGELYRVLGAMIFVDASHEAEFIAHCEAAALEFLPPEKK